ncbi:MAG: divalent-cation tolerance protein CutA [Nitrososphaeria archaeon]|nr:divalent-cation tolerance protein CutA [Aigarchaeota archaeon]MCX8187131.1 divalent-cation tolerance protein CutA [Nitrososphaeria archaeon]MDW8021864.1 divalent-cation tolerance protein CutA [Nitrososphaerota archaeon]
MLGTHVLVMVTAPKREEAERITRRLLDGNLAACVNIVSGIKSLFWWKGEIEEADECLLLIKTRLDKMDELVEVIKQTHSYTVPEIIAIPIIAGNKDYVKWMDQTIERP